MPNHVEVVLVDSDPSGVVDLAELERKISTSTAAVYFENPSYLGMIETQGPSISAIAKGAGAEVIVGADPLSLGIMKPPAQYGANIAVGPTQPLGVHMNAGGGVGGYLASRD
jgi:glycine dehydrogenase subunit 1